MRKFFAVVASICFILTGVLFFVLLNLKVAVFSPEKLKSIASESNFYDSAAAYFKSEVIKDSGLTVNDGSNFEDLNNALTPSIVSSIVNQSVDQIFQAADSDSASNVIPISVTSELSGNKYEFVKKINLTDNLAYLLVKNIDAVVLSVGGLLLLWLLIVFFLSDREYRKRFRWLAGTLICLSAVLAVLYVCLTFFSAPYIDRFVDYSRFVKDTKLLTVIKKLILTAISAQSVSYIVEIIALFVTGLVVIFLSQAQEKSILKEFDTKI